MAEQNNLKKRVVWQDFKPIKSLNKMPPPTATQVVIEPSKPVKKAKPLNKKTLRIIAITIVILSALAATWYFIIEPNFISHKNQSSNTSNDANQTNSNNETPVLSKGNPDFTTISPSGADIASYGGWTRISPENTDPVYAYADKIDDTSISVSEQPLPDNFKDDPDTELKNLAEGFNAAQKITASDMTIYIGTSIKGMQSVIFIKNGLLIMIKSSQIITNNSWLTYIEALK